MTGSVRDGAPIGAMRCRMLLEAPVETPDGAGGVIRDYALVAAIWAQLEWLSGGERWRAGRPEQTATHRITLRWRAGVDAGQRLRSAGRVFDIRSVADPDGSRSRLVCMAEEIGR